MTLLQKYSHSSLYRLVASFVLCGCLSAGALAEPISVNEIKEIKEIKESKDMEGGDLGWGDWNQGVLTLDLDSLPLSSQQRELLNQKIIKLRQDFGVGILGEVEQAISRLDASNLAGDVTGVSIDDDLVKTSEGKTDKFYNDLSLEKEILSLEFANRPVFDDPEGLKSGAKVDDKLYQALLNQLEQLEQQKTEEKVDDGQ